MNASHRGYRDVIDISIGHATDRNTLLLSFASLAFGALLFIWALTSGTTLAAWVMLATFWGVAALLMGRQLCREFLSEGDDLIIDVCKCASAATRLLAVNECVLPQRRGNKCVL